jgi:hypothetical protein
VRFREAGDPQGGAVALGRLARLATARGEHAKHASARAAYAASLRGFHAVGRGRVVALTLGGPAAVVGAEGTWERAVRLAAAGMSSPPLVAVREWGLPDPASVEQVLAQARPALGGPAFAVAWAAGRALSLEQAVADALEEAPPPTASSMELLVARAPLWDCVRGARRSCSSRRSTASSTSANSRA